MNRRRTIRHEFVEYVPEALDEGVLYVSISFRTAVHRCCCGCGAEIATPISRADWQLTFDGDSVTLYPSIGNWSLPCQSHYWIRENLIVWARPWTKKEIARGREHDRLAVERRFAREALHHDESVASPSDVPPERETLWHRIRRTFS
jgi:hypothetical protein